MPGVANPSEVDTNYDTYGNVTEVDRYDFGPTLVSKTFTIRGNYNVSNGTCNPSPAHIPASLCLVGVANSAGQWLTGTGYAYDSTGSLITTTGGALSESFTYNSNGTLASHTAVDGVQTSFAYNGTGGCNDFMPTSQTNAIGTTSTTWDCNGAVPLTTTDLNGLVTTTTYGDPLYRVTQISNNGGQAGTVFSYSPTAEQHYQVFNGTSNLVETTTTVNSLGQLISVQHEQGWGLSWDTQSFTYDSTGHLASKSQHCSTTTQGATCPSTAETYTYDGANRPLTITTNTTPNGALSFSYQNGDVTTTLSPAPTGENTKTTVTEMDGLGRVTGVCAIASLPGVGNCGLRTTSGGYATKYTLDELGRATQISRNAQAGGTPQNSTVTYDEFSRITQQTFPESGTSSFLYDVANGSTCTAFLAGHLTSFTDNDGNVTCFGYDSMGRKVIDTVNAGPYASTSKVHQFAYDSNPQGGAHTIGRLARAYTCVWPCTSLLVDEQFGYDIYGRKTDVWETTPALSGSYFHTTATYWDNGALATLGGIPGVSNYTFGLDGASRPNSASEGSTSIVSSVSYDHASRPLTITYGNGDKDNYSWDAASSNMTQYQFVVGSANTTDTGVLTWNPNGTLQKLAIADNVNSADTQTCTTAHDDLSRITSYACGALFNETYSFDFAGNVTKSGSVSFAPGYNTAHNQEQNGTTYDANGNTLHDATLNQNYTWDAFGGLVSYAGHPVVNDAFGNMVEKTVGSTNTFFVLSPIGKLGSTSSLTALVSIEIPLPGGPFITYKPSSTKYLNRKDWMGSIRLMTNQSTRAFFNSASYGPLGEQYVGTWQQFEGTGQWTTTGLNDYGSTRYSGAQGRNISPTGGANGYVKTNSPF